MWSLVPQASWRRFCSFYLLAEPDSTGRLRLPEPDSTRSGTRLLGIRLRAVDNGEGCGVWFRPLPPRVARWLRSARPERMLAVFDEEVVQRLLHQVLDGAVLINSEPLQLTHGFRDFIEDNGLFADAVGLLQLRHRGGALGWTGNVCRHGLSSLQLRKRRGLTHAA